MKNPVSLILAGRVLLHRIELKWIIEYLKIALMKRRCEEYYSRTDSIKMKNCEADNGILKKIGRIPHGSKVPVQVNYS